MLASKGNSSSEASFLGAYVSLRDGISGTKLGFFKWEISAISVQD